MAQLAIEINGRPYTVGCEDGQEARLIEIAKIFDTYVRQVGQDVGQLGETRLFLMGALLLADELSDMKLRLARAQADLASATADQALLEQRAVQALESAATKIEGLAAV